MPRMKRVIFYLSPEHYAKLKELADEHTTRANRISVAHLIREAIAGYLSQLVKQDDTLAVSSQ